MKFCQVGGHAIICRWNEPNLARDRTVYVFLESCLGLASYMKSLSKLVTSNFFPSKNGYFFVYF